MAEKKQDADLVQQFEQTATSMENVAEIMAVYHEALTKKGVPPALAHDLVMDYSQNFWSMILISKNNADL